VVENRAINQLSIKTILDDFGVVTEIADNGKIALEKMKLNRYDIILMDLQMPEMNGFETTDYIRNTMKSSVPIVALTADLTTIDASKFQQSGLNDYIAKPIDEAVLFRKMVALIKNSDKTSPEKRSQTNTSEKEKCINIEYLRTRTKSNPTYLKEMIMIYLDQIPSLVALMKASFETQKWQTLSATAHKLIPSFSIMGMNPDFETLARKIQDFSNNQIHMKEISEMIIRLEAVCEQACRELKDELRKLS
jgi:hypothetical protein